MTKTQLCEHGVALSLLGGRLSCKVCSDALATENDELKAAIKRAIERLEKFGVKGSKQVGRALMGLEQAIGIDPMQDCPICLAPFGTPCDAALHS